jgi:hypothetical protein
MEKDVISETKYGKTRSAQIKTSVFATSDMKEMSKPLQSRFFIVEQEAYTFQVADSKKRKQVAAMS